jgi:hypothetical protein
MVNMKMSKKEAEKMTSPTTALDAPDYPYGLCLSLDKEAIGKLAMGKPAGGDEFLLTAKVFVKEVSVTDRADGDGYESMQLQITDMALEKPGKMDSEKVASSLYGKKG